MSATMRGVMLHRPSELADLAVEQLPVPEPGPGEVLVRVRAVTVMSSELASIRGVSLARIPLILGNEFVGEVAHAPGGEFEPGQQVAVAYSGHGYEKDGAWAEYVSVLATDLMPFRSDLPWSTLAVLPAAFKVASCAIGSLRLESGSWFLVRGGTSGVGLAAITLAAAQGVHVVATTRDESKRQMLLDQGAERVLIDTGSIHEAVLEQFPEGVDFALEMLGITKLHDTMLALKPFGMACITGLLADQAAAIESGIQEDRDRWEFPHALHLIPPTRRLTNRVPAKASEVDFQSFADGMASGRYRMPIAAVFPLDDIGEALRARENPDTVGKIVLEIG